MPLLYSDCCSKLLTFYSKNDTLLLQDTRWQASDLAVRPSSYEGRAWKQVSLFIGLKPYSRV